ncbi:MAG: TolC family protein [Planctomycetes bacterium]|nr:TolC family protein [Planctomycetota bacterium]
MGSLLFFLMLVAACLPGCMFIASVQTMTSNTPDHLSLPLTKTDGPAGGQRQNGGEPSPGLTRTPGPMQLRTVAAPESPPRPISLVECMALALENGRTGEFFDAAGSERRTSVTGSGRVLSPSDTSDSIRVFAFDPAVLATETEQSLARFDAIWNSGFSWNRTNRRNSILAPSPSDEFLLKNQLDAVGFQSSLLKPLPTGGVAGVTFAADYANQAGLPSSQFVNPGYRPLMSFILEQPLLRGAGVPINQILDSHPGGFRNTFATSNRVPGILLARIGHAKSQLEFERRIHDLVFKVEQAYWNLYSAYWELHSRENGLKQAHQAWLIAKNKQAAGGLGDADLAMIEEQYHFFRTQRLEALGRGTGGRAGVLEAERHLRYVVGLPAEDGARLVPKDEPALISFAGDWHSAWLDATRHRPELKQVHQDIKAAQLLLIKAKELLKPDLRLYSKYGFNGLGGDLGSGLNDLIRYGRPEWEAGVHMQIPIGFREGHAETSRASLAIAQQMAHLQDQEAKLVFSLQRSFRDLVQFREEMQTRRSQQEAALKQLKARLQKWHAGGVESVDLILRAQRNWVDAVRDEQAAVCGYRIALADFERQKGTILRSRQIVIADGRLPACVQPQASSQIRSWFRGTRPPIRFGLQPPTKTAPDGPTADLEPFVALPFDPLHLPGPLPPLDSRTR